MLKKLGLPADKVKQLYKKGGQVLIRNKPEICPVCQGIGYKGQTGLFEVFRIGPAERELIKAQNWGGLRGELRKQGLPTLNQAALRRAVEGATSIEEVSRISSSGGSNKPAQPPAEGSQQAAVS
jgi:type II secretory ATPase GspE/PulE/Tfp pilus assembly ATPase PilB-like protein